MSDLGDGIAEGFDSLFGGVAREAAAASGDTHTPPEPGQRPTQPPPKPEGVTRIVHDAEPRYFASSVKLTVDSKGSVKPEIKVYVGTTSAEMQDALDLAFDTLNAAARKLGLPSFSPTSTSG